jgi:hypothetical protein
MREIMQQVAFVDEATSAAAMTPHLQHRIRGALNAAGFESTGRKFSAERLYRNNYSIYNVMFYNVYYGLIGKRCFAPRWRCVSYMEIAPLAPPLYFGSQPIPSLCRRSSTLRSDSENRTYSITAKRMISRLVLK